MLNQHGFRSISLMNQSSTMGTSSFSRKYFLLLTLLILLQKVSISSAIVAANIDDFDALELSRHRHRRQRQHNQRKRRLKQGNYTLPPVTVLQDTSTYKRKYPIGSDMNAEPVRTFYPQQQQQQQQQANIFANLPTADAARPLTPTTQSQIVYVNFTVEGTFMVRAVNENNPNQIGGIGPFPLYPYSLAEQAEILDRLRDDFGNFPVEFVTTPPASGMYATIAINTNTFLEVLVDNDNNILQYNAVLFGEADHIDFRNRIINDRATVDANFWSLLILLEDLDIFYTFAGLDPNAVPVNLALSQVMVLSTANTVAHELGHLLGLRHLDSFGAPGDGINDLDRTIGDFLRFVPEYPGPFLADETFNHLLASGASVGLTFDAAARVNQFFSERSALKLSLAFSTDYPLLSEAEFSPPEALSDIFIPNTIVTGENEADGPLVMQSLIVEGRISAVDEVDAYLFSLEGSRFLTVEILSYVDASTFDDVVTRLQLYQEQPDGTFLFIRESFQEIESFDPILLDVPIPIAGNYQIRVDAPATVYTDGSGELFPGTTPTTLSDLNRTDLLTGDYQLFLYSHVVPLETGTSVPTISTPRIQTPSLAPVPRSPVTLPTRPYNIPVKPTRSFHAPSYTSPLPPVIFNKPPVKEGKGVSKYSKGKGRDSYLWAKSNKFWKGKMSTSKNKSYQMKSYQMKLYQMKWYKGMVPSMKKTSKNGNLPQWRQYDQSPSYYGPNPSPYKGTSPSDYRPKRTPYMTKGMIPYKQPHTPTYNKKMSSKSHKIGAHPQRVSKGSVSSSNQRPLEKDATTSGMKVRFRKNSPFSYQRTHPPRKHYFFYKGEDKGNRGNGVFAFGGAK